MSIVIALFMEVYTVKPPNKGHIGDNMNSHALSLIYREVVLFSEVSILLLLWGNCIINLSTEDSS